MAILSASGKNLIEAVRNNLSNIGCENSLIGVISTCDGRLEALGSQVFKVQDEIIKFFNNKPFIALYCGGEGAKKPHENIKYGNVTFNTFILKNK